MSDSLYLSNLHLTFTVICSFIRKPHSPNLFDSTTCLRFCMGSLAVFSEELGWITWHRRGEIVALSVPAVAAMTGMGHFLGCSRADLTCNGYGDDCAAWQQGTWCSMRHRWQTLRKRHRPPQLNHSVEPAHTHTHEHTGAVTLPNSDYTTEEKKFDPEWKKKDWKQTSARNSELRLTNLEAQMDVFCDETCVLFTLHTCIIR